MSKNRFANKLPSMIHQQFTHSRLKFLVTGEVYRVMLKGTTGSDYINASFINVSIKLNTRLSQEHLAVFYKYIQGYKQRDAYIAAQGPLENTVEDFWRMMWEYQCGCIVMLCQLEEDGQVCRPDIGTVCTGVYVMNCRRAATPTGQVRRERRWCVGDSLSDWSRSEVT